MSMTTSPFGTPVAETPAAVAAPVEEPAGSGKRNAVILGLVAAALAAGAGAYFLLFAGGDPETVAAPVVPRTPRVVASAPAAVPAAPPIKKFVAKKTRNPFVPLVAVPVVAAAPVGAVAPLAPVAPVAPSGTTSGGTTGGTISGTATGGTTSGTATGSGTTSGSTTGNVPAPSVTKAPMSSKPVDVSVLKVDFTKRTASIKVNRNTYDRSIGETFASYFKLIGVTKNNCAYVQYGDVALPMCVGQPLTLQ